MVGKVVLKENFCRTESAWAAARRKEVDWEQHNM
jgi:hypothetical protein